VYVIAPPEGGKANEELVAVLAGALGIARSRIAIVRGHTSRSKVVVVEGLSESAVAAALAQPPDR